VRALARIAIAGLVASPSIVHAEHEHGMGMRVGSDANTITASLAFVAAQFDTMSYGGDYEGSIPQLAWSRGRFGATASIAMYRLQENGRSLFGLGDFMVSGSAVLATGERAQLATSVMVMAPTGEMADGLGMGHPMGMATVGGAYHTHPITLRSSVGFGHALAIETIHHNHGAWPLVEPMNMSEIVWSAGGEVAVTRELVAGPRVWGGLPVGAAGVTRVAAGVRVAWIQGKVSTAAELQAGLAGDPFTVRGVLETSVSF
jgi:hypothetical protein